MSGRRGYTKSNHPLLGRIAVRRARARPAINAAPAPAEHRLVFMVPAEVRNFVSAGPHGPGITVSPPNVTVTHWDRETALERAASWLQDVGSAHDHIHVTGVLQTLRSDDSRDGARDTVQMSLHRGAVLIWYGAQRPKYVAPKR